MRFEISETQVQNLMVFLDRIPLQGLKEISAINEILAILNNPIKEDKEE
jgi:hypothetical protein